MKKLITIIAAFALIVLSGANAHAAWPFEDDGWSSSVFSVVGDDEKFSILIQGKLSTTQLDEMHSFFGVIGEYDDGTFLFEDRSNNVDSVLVFGDDIIGVAGKFLESELTPDLSFRIEYLIGPDVTSSEKFYLCEMRNAENLCACNNEVACSDGSSNGFVVQPIPVEIADFCPNDPDKIMPGLCGCGEIDVDDNNNGICDVDESSTSNPVIDDIDQDGIADDEDMDNDNDGWSDIDEDACVTDPLDPNDRPLDDDGDGICNLLDDDAASSTSSDGTELDSSADEFGGGNCSLNPNASADFGMFVFLALLCLTTPIAVTLHIRRKR